MVDTLCLILFTVHHLFFFIVVFGAGFKLSRFDEVFLDAVREAIKRSALNIKETNAEEIDIVNRVVVFSLQRKIGKAEFFLDSLDLFLFPLELLLDIFLMCPYKVQSYLFLYVNDLMHLLKMLQILIFLLFHQIEILLLVVIDIFDHILKAINDWLINI